MTQSTEQERAEFEAWARDRYPSINLAREGDEYRMALAKDYWSLWQAARRAQVVGMSDAQIREILLAHGFTIKDGLTDLKPYVYEAARALLATAPQPPEAGCSVSNAETEAAPVQMPEPFTTLVRKTSWSPNCYEASPRSHHKDYGRQWADERVNVYTEHQVRELLAAHGAK